ncbi:MAG: hypothetical protein ACREJ5_19050 [Geminicoccaceae bacterium]
MSKGLNVVAVHDIPLSESDGGQALAAVALPLSAPSGRDRVHRFQAEGWEVELRQRRRHVVARTAHPLVGDALLDAAIDIAHRALDLSSVENGDHLLTEAPVDNHIMLERVDGRQIVRYQSAVAIPLAVEAKGTVAAAAPTITHPGAWKPAFRFYRLSQSSRDHFNAYRNMFLGLEALLDELFPKRKRENEKDWLLRSVKAGGAKVDLPRLATPGAADPARDLVDRLYGIRLKLFHAKIGRTLIPDDRVGYTEVADAYPLLLALWTEIARGWLSPVRRGARLCPSVFRAMMEVDASLRFGVTSDATEPSNDGEWPPIPRESPVFAFARPTSITESRPGRLDLCGWTEVSDMPAGQVVARVVAVDDDGRPQMSDSITGGLILEGADVFETAWTFRLVDRYQQRASFP